MPKCILIVDDSVIVRTATRHFLQNHLGFEVCGEAVDGLDALEKARYLKPYLILLDFLMPRMNGLQAARELRSMLTNVPIVLFTQFADAVRPQDALAAGVNAIVSKDDFSGLQQSIENLLVAA